MAKYSKKHLLTEKSKDDAMKIARGTQKPGQTKEQTKLIAQGIQKGIEIYKKKQSEKARELDKKLNKASALRSSHETSTEQASESVVVKGNKLPWVPTSLPAGGNWRSWGVAPSPLTDRNCHAAAAAPGV